MNSVTLHYISSFFQVVAIIAFIICIGLIFQWCIDKFHATKAVEEDYSDYRCKNHGHIWGKYIDYRRITDISVREGIKTEDFIECQKKYCKVCNERYNREVPCWTICEDAKHES